IYGGNPEHTFYSLTPKLTPKAPQRIGKARRHLLRIPRRNDETSSFGLLLEIPEPHHRVQPKTQSRRPLRTLAFVGLRLLAAEKLLGLFEGILDRPAVGVAGQDVGRVHCHVGGETEIVFFFATGGS